MIDFYISDIQSWLTDLDDITETANRQNGEINSMFSALRTKMERAIKKLERDLATAKQEKTRANDNLEHNRATEAKIKAEIERIEAEIERLEDENDENEREIEKINRKIDAIAEISGKRSGGMISTLEAARDGLEEDVRKNNKKIEKNKKTLEELKKKLEAVKRAIARLKEIISAITADISALRAAHSAVKQAASRLGSAAESYDMAYAQARGQFEYAREHTVNALTEAQELIACFGRMGLDTFTGHFAISTPDILNHLSMDISHSSVMINSACGDIDYYAADYRFKLRDNITRQTGEIIDETTDYCRDLCFSWDNVSLELKNAYYRAKNYLDQRMI